ncbi:MAG: HEAT repeat domain-containing protein [Planctomycetota bacterium]
MRSSHKAPVVPTVLATLALAVAVTAVLRTPAAALPNADTDPELATAVRDLQARVTRLEGQPAATSARPQPDDRPSEPTTASTPIERSAVDVALRQQLAELTTRLHNLEQAAARDTQQRRSLAEPDSIPAALAVLLASRGVVTKVGDIEAIQQNLGVLAAIAADPTCGDWDRIEAFRGMLTFGFDEPETCAAAAPGLASLLLTSTDAKARRSAAAMLLNYADPAISNTVLTAFSREPDAAVRSALLPVLLKLRDDPSVLQLLQQAAANDPDPGLRTRIAKALE